MAQRPSQYLDQRLPKHILAHALYDQRFGLGNARQSSVSCSHVADREHTGTAGLEQMRASALGGPWLLSVPYRKALPNTGRAFQFVDHRDGVILN